MPVSVDKFFKGFFSSPERILETTGLLAFFVPSISDPIIFMQSVKHNKKFSPDQRKTMIQQNWTHHLFNLLIEAVSLIAAKPLIGFIYRNHPKVDFYKSVSGFVALMLAKSFIRPFVMIHFAEQEKLKENKLQTDKPDNGMNVSVSPMRIPAGNYSPKPYIPPLYLSPVRRYCYLHER